MISKSFHWSIALLICALLVIGLHVLGALKHHIIDKDNTLVRIFPKVLQNIWLYILMLFLVVFGFGVLNFGFVQKIQKNISKDDVKKEQVVEKVEAPKHNLH